MPTTARRGSPGTSSTRRTCPTKRSRTRQAGRRSEAHRGFSGQQNGLVIPERAVPILRDPAFGRLWFIQASTQIGGNMALYALTILVFATTRSNAAVSALVMSFLIPTILLSAVAGVLVDRLAVRWALIVPNTLRTLLTLGLAVAGTNIALLLVFNL